MEPIVPSITDNLKYFTKEEEAVFDFIVSPKMQKYLEAYKREVQKY